MRLKRILVATLAATLATTSGAQNLPDLGEASQASFTPQNERRLGEMIMREIRRDPAYLDDPEATAYIETIGRRLVGVSSEARQDFEFFLVRDNTINAFALPGGFVGVHSGLLLAAQSESELAGVLAHEIAHVTQRHIARQFEKQDQLKWPLIAGLLVALLAARSSPQAAQAAIATSQAGAIQASLNYSRDFEREADRVGFQLLEQSGYDVNGMPGFFERLLKSTRFYENNAPAYLRTHPLTTERMADLQNRAAGAHYKQSPDSIEFQLARAKLRATQGAPRDAVAALEAQLRDRRFGNEAATHYGLATALLASRDPKRAEIELATARKLAGSHPMFDTLDAQIKLAMGQGPTARDLLAQSIKENGRRPYLLYAYAETLQTLGQHREALTVLDDLNKLRPHDARLYNMQAKSYAATGARALQHRAQAESYYLQGSTPAAVEQLQLATSAGDANFYLQSQIDVRLRELKRLQIEEKKEQFPR